MLYDTGSIELNFKGRQLKYVFLIKRLLYFITSSKQKFLSIGDFDIQIMLKEVTSL